MSRKANERFWALRGRLKRLALRIIKLYASLPKRVEAQVLGRQLLRSGTSVGAQYCEARRAKSRADFVSKIEGSAQELEESLFWMELLADAGLVAKHRMKPLMEEVDQLSAIFVSIVLAAKSKRP